MVYVAVSFILFVVINDYVLCDLRFFFFQAEDGIRDLVRSRGLGDVYKRQVLSHCRYFQFIDSPIGSSAVAWWPRLLIDSLTQGCLLYTSDAADERSRCRSRWSPYH